MTKGELDALKNCASVLALVERRERGDFRLSSAAVLTIVGAALVRVRAILQDYTTQ